jgi:hypothetical protein
MRNLIYFDLRLEVLVDSFLPEPDSLVRVKPVLCSNAAFFEDDHVETTLEALSAIDIFAVLSELLICNLLVTAFGTQGLS